MLKSASFSANRKHRYSLFRIWNNEGPSRIIPWVGLNPSTADENEDDPIIRRCIMFSKKSGYDGLVMLNLFSLVSTDPKKAIADPISNRYENRLHLKAYLSLNSRAALCWGASYPDLKAMNSWVLGQIGQPLCLGRTRDGFPRHPSRVSGESTLEPYVSL